MRARNVLVTGGNGFIGSHLVEHLTKNGLKVIVPYIEINKHSYFHLNKLHKKTIFVRCDLRSWTKTLNLLKTYNVHFIYHLAALPIVDEALENPLDTYNTNVMGTVNILEASRRLNQIEGIIVASTDKSYGKISRARELDPVGGDHPYETSKAAADLIARTYAKTFGLPIVVTRFGNVYGEGDLNFSRIVPGIMQAIVKDNSLIIRSNGKFRRDYIYVKDVVDATFALAKNIKRFSGEAFNISSFENMSVTGLINFIGGVIGVKVKYQIRNTAINEIPVQSVDFAKIRRNLGWKPSYNLLTVVPRIFSWYKSYFER